MANAPAAIRTFLNGAREAQTRLLAELVKAPSDNPPGDCAGHAELAAGLLHELGFEVERHPVPEALVKPHGMISCTNLIVRRCFGDGPVVALNAHGDAVPAGEGWTQDPYGAAVVNGWMYGRGVAVSKSDFTTYAYALLALEAAAAAGARLSGTVELHLTYDEEAGGEIGPHWIIEEGISRPDLAIAAGFSYGVVTAHNGCLHLEVEVNGRSAHAAMPFTGVDALEIANEILSAIYGYRKTFADRLSKVPGIGSPQVTIGLIRGGINTNVVPDRVTFRLDRRIIPEEQPAEVEAELRAVIGCIAENHPSATTIVRRILLAEPLTPLDGGRHLTELLCKHATRVMGEPVRATGVPLYTDARHYSAAGIPVVLYGAGPRTIEEANAHRADERLSLDDLYKATEVVALTLFDLLSRA
jgi:acetylornithine deacetylase/succinyl-diaminopimelate desuccinylase-like protein